VTDAIVLAVRPRGEADRLIDCYTKQLGRIEVRMIGGRKPLSKLSPHCDVGNLVVIRLVEKNQFTLIDALQKTSSRILSSNMLRVITLVRILTPRGVPDDRLWEALEGVVRGNEVSVAYFFKIFGYDVTSALCEACGSAPVLFFSLLHHEFFCGRCGARLPESDIVYCS